MSKLFSILIVLSLGLGNSSEAAFRCNSEIFAKVAKSLPTEISLSTPYVEIPWIVKGALADAGYEIPYATVAKYILFALDKNGIARKDQLRTAITQLMLIEKYPSRMQRWAVDFNYREHLKNELQAQILTESLATTLSRFELIRSPTLYESHFTKLTGKLMKIAIFVASWKMGPIAAALATPPMGDFIYTVPEIELSQKTLDQLNDQGFDRALPAIQAELSLKNRAKLQWPRIRKLYSSLIFALILALTVERPHLIFHPIEHLLTTDAMIAKSQAQIFADPLSNKQERDSLFQGWMEAFKVIHGRYPTPTLDAREWQQNYDADYKTPASQLMVEY